MSCTQCRIQPVGTGEKNRVFFSLCLQNKVRYQEWKAGFIARVRNAAVDKEFQSNTWWISAWEKKEIVLKRLSSPTAKRADFPSWFIKQLFHKDVSKLRHFHIFQIWGETNVMVFSRHQLSCISSGKTSHSTTYVVQKFLSDGYCRLIF